MHYGDDHLAQLPLFFADGCQAITARTARLCVLRVRAVGGRKDRKAEQDTNEAGQARTCELDMLPTWACCSACGSIVFIFPPMEFICGGLCICIAALFGEVISFGSKL